MGRLILVTGGAYSGRSDYAQKRALAIAPQEGSHRVVFVTTTQRSDADLRAELQLTQQGWPGHWSLVEAPMDAAARISSGVRIVNVVLLDGLDLLVRNLLQAMQDYIQGDNANTIRARVESEVEQMCAGIKVGRATAIIVTQEIGLCLPTTNPVNRLYQELLGKANQRTAASADEVVLTVCGIPTHLHGRA